MNQEEKKVSVEMFELWKEHHDKEAKGHRGKVENIERKVEAINSKIDAFLLNLPCKAHVEKFSWLDWNVKMLWTVIIVSGVIGIGLWVLRGIVT